jgi:acetyl esterase/lipase
MIRLPPQSRPNAIALSTGDTTAPDTQIWTGAPNGEIWLRNVVRPTLEPFLPKAGTHTGRAVIVIPGGGFQFVSLSNEGWPVAQGLADQGIAAFVLTYRTEPTPTDEAQFATGLENRFKNSGLGAPTDQFIMRYIELATQDAFAALSLVLSRASEWGIDARRISMLGFSAGAITALSATLAGAKPETLGLIYPPMAAVPPLVNPPPLFVALASDDPLFGGQGFGLVEGWQGGGGAVELHYYADGGHGFGTQTKGTTSDAWIGQYKNWLDQRARL